MHSEVGRRLIALADALTDAGVKFAFGGALALAYHVDNPRATTDIDVDILVEPTESTIARLVDILGALFEIPPSKSAELLAMGQARLMWDHIPVDVFTHTHEFHDDIAVHIEYVEFEGRVIPILSALHLAVFKAFFDRPKDWVDLQEMAFQHTFPRLAIIGWLRTLLGEDHRIERLKALDAVRPKERTFRDIVEEAKSRE